MNQPPKLLPPQLAALAVGGAAVVWAREAFAEARAPATFGERYRAYRASVRRWV